MLPSGLLVHIPPPRFDACWLGVRAHSPPTTIRCLLVPPAGLHPSAPTRSPVSTGDSAACRLRDSCPTGLSSRSGLQPPFRLDLSVASAFPPWSASLASPT